MLIFIQSQALFFDFSLLGQKFFSKPCILLITNAFLERKKAVKFYFGVCITEIFAFFLRFF